MPRAGVSLCIRADFEPATYLGSLALGHAINYFRSRGITVVDLYSNLAVRSVVMTRISSDDPIFVFGVGHGNASSFTAQNYNRVFWVCNCKELSGRVAFLLSCVTAKELGPDAVRKGCICYIGYDEPFAWVQENPVDPLTDVYGKAFFEPVLELLYRLADGDFTGGAYRASIDKWNYWIDYWSRSEDPNAPLVLQYLIHDRDHQKLIGSPLARIVPLTKIGPSVATSVAMAAVGMAPLILIAGSIAKHYKRTAVV